MRGRGRAGEVLSVREVRAGLGSETEGQEGSGRPAAPEGPLYNRPSTLKPEILKHQSLNPGTQAFDEQPHLQLLKDLHIIDLNT